MFDYYDGILGLIPALLVGVTVIFQVWGYPSVVGASLGASLAAGIMGHAMFVNGPSGQDPGSGRGNSAVAES